MKVGVVVAGALIALGIVVSSVFGPEWSRQYAAHVKQGRVAAERERERVAYEERMKRTCIDNADRLTDPQTAYLRLQCLKWLKRRGKQ